MNASSASTNPTNHTRTRWLYGLPVALVLVAFILLVLHQHLTGLDRAILVLPQPWMTR
jgi:Trk-type K+ transport system membrane component